MSPGIKPLKLFEGHYTPSVHLLVQLAMGEQWWLRYGATIQQMIDSHLDNSQVLQNAMQLHMTTRNEAGAIAYYSADVRQLGGQRSQSVFSVLHQLLAKRDLGKLEVWKPFLFILLRIFGILHGLWVKAVLRAF